MSSVPRQRAGAASSAESADPPIRTFYQPKTYHAEESVGHLMRRITTLMGQALAQGETEPGGPTFPQWAPLYKLHLGHATTVAELARECQLDTGAMTRLLDRLEAKDLVRRVRSQADRRVVNIELTDEGRAAAQQVPHVLCRLQNRCLSGFTEAEWQQFKTYLQRYLQNVEALVTKEEHPDEQEQA